MHVIILRGVSGSGKSTWASRFAGRATILSTDDFFYIDGVYRHDHTKLREYHGRTFRLFLDALNRGDRLIIVDNTNVEPWEFSPYALAGEAFGCKTELLTFRCSLETALARKQLVPVEQMERIYDNFEAWTKRMPGRFRQMHRIIETENESPTDRSDIPSTEPEAPRPY